MKKTLKKSMASILAVCMLLSVIGSFGIFGMTAAAAPSYYEFVELPGFTVWTDEELALHDTTTQGYTSAPVHSTESLPEGVDDAIKYTITMVSSDWRAAKISTIYTRNWETSTPGQGLGLEWGARSKINGKDLVGDVDISDCDGIAFWIGTEAGRYTGRIKIQLSLSEARGPFYEGKTDDGANDLGDAPVGYLYESDSLYADDDGYFYFDYETNFRQVDWWGTDDDGVSQSVYDIGEVNTPLPHKVRESWGAMQLITTDIPVGTTLYLADLKAYKDLRIFPDVLEEAVYRFESINVDACTELSYNMASEVYMQAMDMYLDYESYTQEEIDRMADKLNTAIENINKLFPVESDTEVAGFGVWDDSDFESMIDGGICRDLAFVDTSIVLGEDEHSVGIISTAVMGPPDYGWSRFVSLVEGEDGEEALKNPFGVDLSATDGLRFLVSYYDGFFPSGFQIGVGVAGEAYFVASDPDVVYPLEPETSGVVYVPWVNFYDYNGDADIFEYLDRLDYFEISLPEAVQVQINISDLNAFEWGINECDFTALNAAVEAAEADIASKDPAAYYPDGWYNYTAACEYAKSLPETYGVVDSEIEAAILAISEAAEKLLPIAEGVDSEVAFELHNNYLSVKKLWGGNYSLSAANKLKRAIENYEEVMGTALTAEQIAELNEDILAAINSLKQASYKKLDTDITSFESYTMSDFDYCMANRSSGVSYTLGEAERLGVQALKMKAAGDLSGSDPIMSFYTFYNSYLTRPLHEGELVGDLTGATGFMIDVEVNDLSLAPDATLSFGLINWNSEKPFNRSADGIALPASGCGTIYVPTYMFTNTSASTNSISYSDIEGYFFSVQGEVKAGFEIAITNIKAYSGASNVVPEAATISNIVDGETYDAGIIPVWDNGVAMLDGEAYTYGTPVMYNGEHTLVVITGSNRTTVNFTIVGGIDKETVDLGDADGDGQITVSDALYTLRIAAKLAEGTSADLRVIDIDGDGAISVADALAILRVAAKLVESL